MKCQICENDFTIKKSSPKNRIYCYDCCPEYLRRDKKTYINRQIAMRQAMKKAGVKLLGGKCAECGYNECIAALQFHHINPQEKTFNFSNSMLSWKKYKEELKKCKLLCANCHLKHHYEETHSSK